MEIRPDSRIGYPSIPNDHGTYSTKLYYKVQIFTCICKHDDGRCSETAIAGVVVVMTVACGMAELVTHDDDSCSLQSVGIVAVITAGFSGIADTPVSPTQAAFRFIIAEPASLVL